MNDLAAETKRHIAGIKASLHDSRGLAAKLPPAQKTLRALPALKLDGAEVKLWKLTWRLPVATGWSLLLCLRTVPAQSGGSVTGKWLLPKFLREWWARRKFGSDLAVLRAAAKRAPRPLDRSDGR